MSLVVVAFAKGSMMLPCDNTDMLKTLLAVCSLRSVRVYFWLPRCELFTGFPVLVGIMPRHERKNRVNPQRFIFGIAQCQYLNWLQICQACPEVQRFNPSLSILRLAPPDYAVIILGTKTNGTGVENTYMPTILGAGSEIQST